MRQVDYYQDTEDVPRMGCAGSCVAALILAALLFGLTSCRSTKKVIDIDYQKENTEVVTKKDTVVQTVDQERVNKQTDRIVENLSEEIVNVWFSAPDSAGNQYVIQEQRIVRNSNKDTKKEQKDSVVTKIESQEVHNENAVRQDHEQTVIHQEETKKPGGALWKSLLALIPVLLLVGCYLVYRYFLADKD